jgi:hypothetical protein
MTVTKEQRDLVFNRLGYRPGEIQSKAHDLTCRVKLIAGGERSGKSFWAANEYLGQFWARPYLWLVAADYERTKPEFDYICDGFNKLGIKYQASKDVNPGEIVAEGGFRIETKSAKDPRKLASLAPDMIIGCEASQLMYEDFIRLRGRLIEKRGVLVMSGSFESSLGWYPQMYQLGQAPNALDLVSLSMPTWTNSTLFPGGREDPEIKSIEHAMTPEWFMERFGGVPCPPKGMVFNEFRTHIHTGIGGNYEFDPKEEVQLFVDPGYAEAYAVLIAQKRTDGLWVIDEVYEKNMVTSDIIKVCKQKSWWNNVTGGAIDVAGTQHQAMAAPAEIWLREGGITLRSKKIAIKDSIEVTKRFLLVNPITNQPLLHVNSKCTGLISEMGGCPNPFDGQTKVYSWRKDKEGNVIGDNPEDRFNHSSKALAYGLIDLYGYSLEARKNKVPVKFI